MDRLWPGCPGAGRQCRIIDWRYRRRTSSPGNDRGDFGTAIAACRHILPVCSADHPPAIDRISEERLAGVDVPTLGRRAAHAAKYDDSAAWQSGDRALRFGPGVDDDRHG